MEINLTDQQALGRVIEYNQHLLEGLAQSLQDNLANLENLLSSSQSVEHIYGEENNAKER